jgi:hypothetical protein
VEVLAAVEMPEEQALVRRDARVRAAHGPVLRRGGLPGKARVEARCRYKVEDLRGSQGRARIMT